MRSGKGIAQLAIVLVIAAGFFTIVLLTFKNTDNFVNSMRTLIYNEAVIQSHEAVAPGDEDGSPFDKYVGENSTDDLEKSRAAKLFKCVLNKYMSQPDLTLEYKPLIQDFPTVVVSYPIGWPEDYSYPSYFKLMQAKSGRLSAEVQETFTYRSKHRFQGTPYAAACAAIKYFEDLGWKVSDVSNFEYKGYVMTIENPYGLGSVLINVEVDGTSDDGKNTFLIITVWPYS